MQSSGSANVHITLASRIAKMHANRELWLWRSQKLANNGSYFSNKHQYQL